MRKKFLEAVPGLNIDAELAAALNDIYIDCIKHSADMDAINLYVSSDKPVPPVIYSVEDIIKRQLFADKNLSVHIIAKMDVSSLASNAQSDVNKASSAPSAAPAAKTSAPSQNSQPKSGAPEGKKWKKRAPKDPDLIYGRDCAGNVTRIENIIGEMDEVIVEGVLFNVEERGIRDNTAFIFTFAITDKTDSISGKFFADAEKAENIREFLKNGASLRMKGRVAFDNYEKEMSLSYITGVKPYEPEKKVRVDNAPVKRVELHCHSKMSDMDAVSDISSILKRAAGWGHSALAVTDHGVVQAFTDADHTKLPSDFHVIYGVEGYLVDDTKELIKNEKGQSLEDTFVVFDIETTGLSYKKNEIIEIGAVKIEEGQITDRFSAFVKPSIRKLPLEIVKLTNIDDSMLADAEPIEVVLPLFLEWCGDAVIVAHNAEFDTSFINRAAQKLGLPYEPTIADTLTLARVLFPEMKKFKLDTLAKKVGVQLSGHHRAVNDAEATAGIFLKFIKMLHDRDVHTLYDCNVMGSASDDLIKKAKPYHIILLAKNDVGRINLYRLVSLSHLRYYQNRPRIPKSELIKYREGLIIGSACEAGELFSALLQGEDDETLKKIASFYDYLEIQPVANNFFIIREQKYGYETVKDLEDANKKIVELGDALGKPVCATCDVHFLDPEDEIYRRIILFGNGFKDADDQPPLYLRTTNEMLDEFTYLGEEKAYEVVVTNTNMIANMCEKIHPVRPDKAPPVIENSDETLRELCYKTAHDWYGEELPAIVVDRLERELTSIISNGYAVMYIIAWKLVARSNEDGYLVGSRGSVGSSFVATMSTITEVNPLPPHYRCPNCKHSDFDDPACKENALGAGCDMPDKNCPVCGAKMLKDGYDIPFETFLGFKGDKEPDIDLNFSGEYQSRAHSTTEEIFGEGHTFRAGTIGTLAEKTAFGYTMKYYEDHGMEKRRCEIERVSSGCVGVRRTTGQHPGGIIVLPYGEDIYSFTPIQHPANDVNTPIITTHFDYHSIDHNLLKLDILGHDDPTMIRRLEDLTGLDATKIPLDDDGVMGLFKGTEPLGITPADIGGTPLGVLGVPEFGTDFAMQMLIDAGPQNFADLVRIAGLAHGTNVWLGNARDYILEGTATLKTAICTRDDIMLYLISMGIDPALSFKIMEQVRKGKVAKGACDQWDDWKEEMLSHGVPQWYVDSCQKIEYMFPKAHAAAYVMMAWRVAWFKINYPLAYYAAFFSIRATAFSYELMCLGKDKLDMHIAELREKEDDLSNKEKDTLKDMRLVQEMYARGFEFAEFDIYKADAHKFQVIDGKILPSFSSISGMGDIAAESAMKAAREGEFLSRDDFKERSKISQTIVDKMNELGMLGAIPKSNQFSFFDMLSMDQ